MRSYKEITYRYLKVQKKRTALTVLGIILSVALVTSIGTLLVSMRDKQIQDVIARTGDYYATFTNVAGAQVNKIRNNVQVVNSAVTKNEGDAIITKISEQERKRDDMLPSNKYLTVKAYDQAALKLLPITLKAGRLPQRPGEIIIDYWAAEFFPSKPKIGDNLKLALGVRKSNTGTIMGENSWSSDETFEKTADQEYKVVGFIKPNVVYMGMPFANAITYFDDNQLVPNLHYNVFAKFNGTSGIHQKAEKLALAAQLDKNKNPIEYNESLLRLYAASSDSSTNTSLILLLAFIGILIIISTIAVIYNAFHISVLERISQFGILRCTGASPAQIRNIVLREAGILSLLGIPLGLVSGIAAMEIVLHIVALLNFEPFEGINVVISPLVLGISVVIGLLTIFLSAYGPARQAGRVSPLEAVRNTGNFKKENFKKVKNSRLAHLLFGTEGQIAYKNLRRNRKRFRITVFSMVISIILYIVFASFSDFMFRMGVVNTASSGDFLLQKSGVSTEGITKEIYQDIRGLPGVARVYRKMNADTILLVPENKINPRLKELWAGVGMGKLGDLEKIYNNQLICYGNDNLSELQKYLTQGNIDVDQLNRENGVILIKTNMLDDAKHHKTVMLDALNYGVGDELQISDKNTVDSRELDEKDFKTVKVLGVMSQGILHDTYGRGGGVILITTEEVYRKITGDNVYQRLFIDVKKDANRDSVSKYLQELQSKDENYIFIDYVEQAKKQRQSAIVISIFLYGFVGVITLIGCLNIINTISTNLILRTRELSIFKAIGMTTGGIMKMVCLEGIYYGMIAAIYGGLAGTGLSYLLFKIVMDIREFEWVMPWKHIMVAIVGAVVVTLLASLVPLHRINRGNIIENIRLEE